MVFARVPYALTTSPNHLTYQDGVCQGSLRSHHISKPSHLPRWCLPGFPTLSPHLQTISPTNMVFARVPYALTTSPNHLTYQDGVCQGSLRSHHISKPSDLPRWCLPRFPTLSPHLQTISPTKMVFARVPYALTTSPNHLTYQDGVCHGSLRSHHISKPSDLPRWCLPGFPTLSPHLQTISPTKMVFARVPYALTTSPNHLTYQDGVCQGSLRSHHISKPSHLPRWCLPGFPTLSPHLQTISPTKMVFARVPYALTTSPNHLTYQDGVCQGSLRSHHISKPSHLPHLSPTECHASKWLDSKLSYAYLDYNQNRSLHVVDISSRRSAVYISIAARCNIGLSITICRK